MNNDKTNLNNNEHTESFTSGSQNMNTSKKNPVLEFVLNVADTAKYIWEQYLEWIIDVSWGKLFLASLLTLIAGGLLCVQSLATWLVIGSLLLKCFIGKEDQQIVNQAIQQTEDKKPDEES
ncbi:hypothetical protein [Undibacterium fentianense]|uniref:Uncharacterized protein n=1 Tax=Undibacterium fentianense TaxID=2828728 RepID=A0A941E4S2_9BURK|nr:hypothetical protein [Undibacterium fentianense]MBR7800609.1 hypothetical protein [Undibacterium fentianense]